MLLTSFWLCLTSIWLCSTSLLLYLTLLWLYLTVTSQYEIDFWSQLKPLVLSCFLWLLTVTYSCPFHSKMTVMSGGERTKSEVFWLHCQMTVQSSYCTVNWLSHESVNHLFFQTTTMFCVSFKKHIEFSKSNHSKLKIWNFNTSLPAFSYKVTHLH